VKVNWAAVRDVTAVRMMTPGAGFLCAQLREREALGGRVKGRA
jgi:hypothetical protein